MAKQPAKKPAAKTPATNAAAKKAGAKPAAPKPAASKSAAKPAPKGKAVSAGPLLPPPPKSKFTLFDLLGQPRAFYTVERVEPARPPVDPKSHPLSHGIMVIDRSGSMYAQMREVREVLLRLFSQPEFRKQPLIVSVVSYSGTGDVEVPISRLPVAEVMVAGGDPQRQIKRMDVATLTSVSTGLRAADALVREGEPTTITLHGDGYSNDPSGTAEAASLKAVCGGLQSKNVAVNTVAHGPAVDFRTLLGIANQLSGACVNAADIGPVYDAMYKGLADLGTASAAPFVVPLPAGCEFQVFISKGLGRVNAAGGPLRVVGLKPKHDAAVYQYRKVSAAEYADLSDVPEVQGSEAVYAFARGQLAEGKLNTAKYAVGSAFDATLTDAHGRALTNPQLAAFAADLDDVLFYPETRGAHRIQTAVPVNHRIPLLDVIRLLEAHPDDYLLNLPRLRESYARRGVDRVRGTRDAGGTLIETWVRPEFLDPDEHVRVANWEINRNAATLNLTVGRRVRLVKVKGNEHIPVVAGAKLDDLKSYESFTVVGDGELAVPRLPVRITARPLFDELVKAGVLETAPGTPAGKFDPKAEYAVRFDHLPLVPPFTGAMELDGLFDELAGLRILSSLCAAHLKEASVEFTSEQAEELKKHFLTRTLHLSFPSAAPYNDRLNALSNGTLDTRTSYRIDLGNKTVLNLSKLHPANKFLERMYEVKVGGKPVEKPKLEDAVDGSWTYTMKHLSSRVKVTRADDLMKDYFDEFLGLKATGKTIPALNAVGATTLAKMVETRLKGKQPDRSAFVAALADARGKIDAKQEELFRDKLSTLVFYIGSTGLLPDELNATAQTADQIAAKYPELNIGKDERDGTFFEAGSTILAVYAKTEDYTPAHK